jgi:putative acetyltransferase
MDVRAERAPDIPAIRDVNRAAFDTAAEADLVDALRVRAAPTVSLVAQADGGIVGHIMFSPVTLVCGQPPPASTTIMGLAPMAVLPRYQKRGIGSALVRAGLDRCRDLGVQAVVVLGHAAYYPRFGFVPASRFGIVSEYDVPDDAFMAIELEAGALSGRSGTIRYHEAFASP